MLTHGEGPYVVDTDGKRYLDANSGLWNMVAGSDGDSTAGLIGSIIGALILLALYRMVVGRRRTTL